MPIAGARWAPEWFWSLRSTVRRAIARTIAVTVRGRRVGTGETIGRVIVRCWETRLVPKHLGAGTIRTGVQFCVASGGGPFALGVARGLAHTVDPTLAGLAHELLLRVGDISTAEALAERGTRRGWLSIGMGAVLESDRRLARGDALGALATLDAVDAPMDTDRARRYVRILESTGRAQDLLDRLESFAPHLSPAEVAIAGFDALWALGRPDEALAIVEPLARSADRHLGLLMRLQRGYGAVAERPEDVDARILDVERRRTIAPDDGWTTVVLSTLGRIDELIAHASRPLVRRRLGPSARYLLANAYYIRRDFDAARSLIAGLLGTRSHWDAEKLESRILLEEGRFAEALEHRRSRPRLGESFDEVAYFARLHLGEIEAALGSYAHRDDVRRLTASFGDRAEERPEDRVDSRFVIPQNGPGDEIMLAGMYELVQERSGRVVAACEPRLQSLLERSFPSVVFEPSERMASVPRPGFLAPERPRRADGPLFDLLTADAMTLAARTDRVILGRSLMGVAPVRVPFAPYLVPDQDRVTAMLGRLGPGVIGVVWRSEFNAVNRSIHYLRPGDLAPLAGDGRRFVCLQHDVTAEERTELAGLFGESMQFLDDVELRNDFEAASAVVAACSAVIGIGTTMVELAGAVGAPTIALHPNRIGAWRARPDSGDYWHRTMRVAVSDDPRDRAGCVRRAAELLDRR